MRYSHSPIPNLALHFKNNPLSQYHSQPIYSKTLMALLIHSVCKTTSSHTNKENIFSIHPLFVPVNISFSFPQKFLNQNNHIHKILFTKEHKIQ